MNPDEVRDKQFGRRFRGFSTEEVREYLEELATALEAREREIDRLSRELDHSQQELTDFRTQSRRLEAALAQSKEAAEEFKANAEREAQVIIAEAELQAEKILGQTHNRLARLHEDISELKRQRSQFEVRLRSLVEAHLKLLDVELERDRELAELEDKIKILRPPSS